jgi:hypothetical protein
MVGVTQPTRHTSRNRSVAGELEVTLQLGEFKMKVSLHESLARPTSHLNDAAYV